MFYLEYDAKFNQNSKEKACTTLEKVLIILESRYSKIPSSFVEFDHEVLEIVLIKISKMFEAVLNKKIEFF